MNNVSDFELEVVEAVAPVQLEYAAPLTSQVVANLLYTQHEVRATLRALSCDMMRNAMLADWVEDWLIEWQSTNPAEYFEPEVNPFTLIDQDAAWEEVAMYLYRLEAEAQVLLQRLGV